MINYGFGFAGNAEAAINNQARNIGSFVQARTSNAQPGPSTNNSPYQTQVPMTSNVIIVWIILSYLQIFIKYAIVFIQIAYITNHNFTRIVLYHIHA